MKKSQQLAEWTLVRSKTGKLLELEPQYVFARVGGGWLVMSIHPAGGLVFVPDPEHRQPPLPIA